MEKYILSNEDVPSTLYRIDYPGSRTIYSQVGGFVAADRMKVYEGQKDAEFRRDIEKQFTWGCRDPLPFISLFSDREHAENWGLRQPWRGNTSHLSHNDWALYVIDTSRLGDTCFMSLRDLVDGLKLILPDKASQHIPGTYVCLHRIPSAAVVERIGPKQVQYGN